MRHTIVVDGREFIPGRITGIGRVLSGLLRSLSDWDRCKKILLAVNLTEGVPQALKKDSRIRLTQLSASPLTFEKQLIALSRGGANLFISPYPKLPFLETHCPAVNIIHDVLYLKQTHCRGRIKRLLSVLRLKLALNRAALTWYDSKSSLTETQQLVGYTGKRPRVRYPGLDQKFRPVCEDNDQSVLQKYKLAPGYILVVGNGRPHKNLGVLLQIQSRLRRRLVLIGVSGLHKNSWQAAWPSARAVWIERIADDELPALMRAAFCLAQPSTAEGFGYPPLEAMACGTPAIVSSISVLCETTGGYALFADPNEPGDWLDALTALEKVSLYRSQATKGLRWTSTLRGKKAWNGYIEDISQVLVDT